MIRSLRAVLVTTDRRWTERLLRKPQKEDMVYITKPEHEPRLIDFQRIVYSAEFRDERPAYQIFRDIAEKLKGQVKYIPYTQRVAGGYSVIEVPASQRQETLKRLENYFGPRETHRAQRGALALDDSMIL